MLVELKQELEEPQTTLGKRYLIVLMLTIIASIIFLFVNEEYPLAFPLGSNQLFIIELVILTIFGIDLVLRLLTEAWFEQGCWFYLLGDLLAIIPSLTIVLFYCGLMDASDLDLLALFRLFRLLRVVKLLRVGKTLSTVFGASVLSLVFVTMTTHLGIRVLVMEIGNILVVDVFSWFEVPVLTVALTAVGSVYGIALAITFGIVKRKQIEITELHRAALDALLAYEGDIKRLEVENCRANFRQWKEQLSKYLIEEISYTEMKEETNVLLENIRDATFSRTSLDVPFHNNLVMRLSAFLTKTQITFHPAFYQWLNHISHIYFILLMFVAQGLTGVLVQMLVIFVFQGLVVIIDDMDHAIDTKVVIFNAKILDV